MSDAKHEQQDLDQAKIIAAIEQSDDYFDILTANLDGLPFQLPSSSATSEGTSSSSTASDPRDQACDPNWNLQNAQLRRIRGFASWLDLQTFRRGGIQPSILCLQEVIAPEFQRLAHQLLIARGYETHENLSLLTRSIQQKKKKTPILDGGLAIYVEPNKFRFLAAGIEIWNKRIGADHLCNKGFAWALLENNSTFKKIVVVNVHLQAYQKFDLDPKPLLNESKEIYALRTQVGIPEIEKMGGFEKAVQQVHKDQLLQLAQFVYGSLLPSFLFPERNSNEPKDPQKNDEGVVQKTESFEKDYSNMPSRGDIPIAVSDDVDGEDLSPSESESDDDDDDEMDVHALSDRAYAQKESIKYGTGMLGYDPAKYKYGVAIERLHGVFFAGDFNINRWDTSPFNPQLSDPVLAQANRKISDEIKMAWKILIAAQPAIVRSPADPEQTTYESFFRDLFTWNGSLNALAKSPLPTNKPTYEWLDYVLFSTLDCFPKPYYMDNHVEPMELTPFPEIIDLWTRPCYEKRKSWISSTTLIDTTQQEKDQKGINIGIEQRFNLGVQQLQRCLIRFNAFLATKSQPPWQFYTQAVDPPTDASLASPIIGAWVRYIRTLPFSETSQLWKGLNFFGYVASDLSESQLKSLPRFIGEPHAYRMLYNVSDHFAVSSRILLG
jgi:hypothetical protein